MPNFDKTGPKGKGARTGLKRGNCNDNTSNSTNQETEYGQGRCFGRGRRNSFGRGQGKGLGRGRGRGQDIGFGRFSK